MIFLFLVAIIFKYHHIQGSLLPTPTFKREFIILHFDISFDDISIYYPIDTRKMSFRLESSTFVSFDIQDQIATVELADSFETLTLGISSLAKMEKYKIYNRQVCGRKKHLSKSKDLAKVIAKYYTEGEVYKNTLRVPLICESETLYAKTIEKSSKMRFLPTIDESNESEKIFFSFKMRESNNFIPKVLLPMTYSRSRTLKKKNLIEASTRISRGKFITLHYKISFENHIDTIKKSFSIESRALVSFDSKNQIHSIKLDKFENLIFKISSTLKMKHYSIYQVLPLGNRKRILNSKDLYEMIMDQLAKEKTRKSILKVSLLCEPMSIKPKEPFHRSGNSMLKTPLRMPSPTRATGPIVLSFSKLAISSTEDEKQTSK